MSECGLRGEVTTAVDIYSYGILLLEMMTGKRPNDTIFEEGLNLLNFVNRALPDRGREVADPILRHDVIKTENGDIDKCVVSDENRNGVFNGVTKRMAGH